MRSTAALVGVVLVLSACGQGAEVASVGPSPTAVDGCPERYLAADDDPWVPAPPGTETPGRLVPDADPVQALVCRYGDLSTAGSAALQGAVLLEGGLDRIRTDLLVPSASEGAERACTSIGGSSVPHLVRLRYADGELWLSAVSEPNRCTATGNGAFVSSAYLGDRLAQAYDSATWPAGEPDPCAEGAPGRAGQERVLVPDGWTSLVVCHEEGRRREVAPDRAQRLASLSSQLRTKPGMNACEGVPTAVRRLAFTYAEGPPVVVRWTPGCEPSVGNGSLSAAPTPAQTGLLEVLLG